MVMDVLSSEDDDRSVKEVTSLVTIIGSLSRQLSPTSEQFEQVVSWLQKVCAEKSVGMFWYRMCYVNVTLQM